LLASGLISKTQKKDDGNGSKSHRPEETITPLSQLINVTIDLTFVKGQETQVAAASVASGGVALIACQHDDIPAIEAAIPGANGFPPPWPGSRFDIVWAFDLQSDGTYSCSQVPPACTKCRMCGSRDPDLPWSVYRATVIVEVHRLRCPECGALVEKIDQLPSKAPFSKRFEEIVGEASSF
jgi:hypothetical protein